MHTAYRACWVSRARAAALKRAGALAPALLLDTFNGLILVEPEASVLADGAVLSSEEADYELQPVWFIGPKVLLRQARQWLGLDRQSASLNV
jgi:hypothetical protein